MYENHYGLTEKPFSILPDPEFLYWGRAHTLAYTMLEYAIMNNAGFTVISGGIGCGKTTLIRHLLNQLDDDIVVGLMSNTQENTGELLQWVLRSFDQPFEEKPYVALYEQFQQFLIEKYGEGKRVILIVDEAQNLGPKSLEELRMLSNINADKDQLLQLILVGQPQLKDLLQRPELIQFSQRVASDFHLQPLQEKDVSEYIHHRLEVAGADHQIFTEEACKAVYDASNGVPRLINILADTALVYGMAEDSAQVSEEIVNTVVEDKREHGVFSFQQQTDTEIPSGDDEKKAIKALAQSSGSSIAYEDEEGPALVIRDKELAKYLLKKLVD